MVENKENLAQITSQIERLRNLDKLNHLFGLRYAFSPALLGNTSFEHGEKALLNRSVFSEIAGFNLANLVCMHVNHGTNVAVVGQEDKGRGVFSLESAIKDTDALVTTEKGVMLGLNVADCPPIIITNSETQFLALVHAGREGTDKRICQNVVLRLGEMGFNPEDFIVGIGPGIGACGHGCYRLHFLETANPEAWQEHVLVWGEEDGVQRGLVGNNRWKFTSYIPEKTLSVELVGFVTAQLTSAGVKKENIESSGLCTFCLSKEGLLFSHQNNHNRESRFMAVVQLT